jgi:hypothetical protein
MALTAEQTTIANRAWEHLLRIAGFPPDAFTLSFGAQLGASGFTGVADSLSSSALTTLTLTGNIADSGTAVGIIFNNANALGNVAAKIASFKNNGVEKLYVSKDGGLSGVGGGDCQFDVFRGRGATTLNLVGQMPDGATAVGTIIDCPGYANGGAKLLSIRNNGSGNEKVYWDKDGVYNGSYISLTGNITAFTYKGFNNNTCFFQANSIASGAAFQFANFTTLNSTGNIATFYSDNASTLRLSINQTGRLDFASPGDSTGSPGNATINSVSGKSAIASAGTAATITNDRVSATSIIMVTPLDTDANVTKWKAVPAAGSFTVTVGAATAAIWKFSWFVINP